METAKQKFYREIAEILGFVSKENSTKPPTPPFLEKLPKDKRDKILVLIDSYEE